MKPIGDILSKITQLTTELESNYPELYIYIEELPISIPSTNHPDINVDTLYNYLEYLKCMMDRYESSRKLIYANN